MNIYINTHLEGMAALGEEQGLASEIAIDSKYIIICVG